MKKYSFWILPPEDINKKIQKAINIFSNDYSAPHFFPHISTTFSINGNIKNIKQKLDKINLTPIKIKSLGISTGNLRWKQVFIKIKKDSEIIELQNKLRATFKESIIWEQKEPFDPHISLIYANNESNEQFSDKVKNEILDKAKTFELELNASINSIYLIDTTSKIPEEWSIVKKINL